MMHAQLRAQQDSHERELEDELARQTMRMQQEHEAAVDEMRARLAAAHTFELTELRKTGARGYPYHASSLQDSAFAFDHTAQERFEVPPPPPPPPLPAHLLPEYAQYSRPPPPPPPPPVSQAARAPPPVFQPPPAPTPAAHLPTASQAAALYPAMRRQRAGRGADYGYGSLLGFNEHDMAGVSGGEVVRERLRKLLETVQYVLGRMTDNEGCVALGVLNAATRRALASPLHGVELTVDEIAAVLAATGGECLLEDCGFERYEPAPAELMPAARYTPPVMDSEPSGGRISRRPPADLSKFEESLWAAFDLADRDGNGTLSKKEFGGAMKAVGLVTTETECLREWEMADTDRSGKVEWKEFLKLGKKKKALAQLPSKLQASPAKVEQAAALIQNRLRSKQGSSDVGLAGTSAPAPAASGRDPAAGPSLGGGGNRTQPRGLSPFELKLWRTFDALLPDEDATSLTRKEIDGALWAARFKVGVHGTKQLAKLFSAADANHDGRIDWDEFKKLGSKQACLAELDPGEVAAVLPSDEPPPIAGASSDHGTVYILQPVASAEGLALLRATADLLERCLDNWVHRSTDDGLLGVRTDAVGDRLVFAGHPSLMGPSAYYRGLPGEPDAPLPPAPLSPPPPPVPPVPLPPPQHMAHNNFGAVFPTLPTAVRNYERVFESGYGQGVALGMRDTAHWEAEAHEQHEAALREASLRDTAAREAEARDVAAKETLASEAAAREAAAREADAREAAAWEAARAEALSREMVIREAAVRDAAARDAAREAAEARDVVARQAERRETAALEAAREAAEREMAARESTAREVAAREAEARAAAADLEAVAREKAEQLAAAARVKDEQLNAAAREKEVELAALREAAAREKAALREAAEQEAAARYAQGVADGQTQGREAGLSEGLTQGRQQGYDQGHADGYDERAAFELEARRLEALPRFVRPMMVQPPPPPPDQPVAPWRPAGVLDTRADAPPLPPATRHMVMPSYAPRHVSPLTASHRPSTAPSPARSIHGASPIRQTHDPARPTLKREGPKTAAYDILRKTADELASLRL